MSKKLQVLIVMLLAVSVVSTFLGCKPKEPSGSEGNTGRSTVEYPSEEDAIECIENIMYNEGCLKFYGSSPSFSPYELERPRPIDHRCLYLILSSSGNLSNNLLKLKLVKIEKIKDQITADRSGRTLYMMDCKIYFSVLEDFNVDSGETYKVGDSFWGEEDLFFRKVDAGWQGIDGNIY